MKKNNLNKKEKRTKVRQLKKPNKGEIIEKTNKEKRTKVK